MGTSKRVKKNGGRTREKPRKNRVSKREGCDTSQKEPDPKINSPFELRQKFTTFNSTVPPLEIQEYTLYYKVLSHIFFTTTILRPGDSRYENLSLESIHHIFVNMHVLGASKLKHKSRSPVSYRLTIRDPLLIFMCGTAGVRVW